MRTGLSGLLVRDRLLSQAVENWQREGIWVLSRADAAYPPRLKQLLGGATPPILYGCGDLDILNSGGLAVVGSRNASDDLRDYATGIGELAADAEWTLVCSGARAIDQAAMLGALEAGGRVAAVLSNDLQRAALQSEHREFLVDGQLVLTSPYDPAAGFNVGHAMARNKLIYALADAALVVSADYQKGGAWAGAVEQLDRLKLAPVYVRSASEWAFQALMRKGARRWPDPQTPEEFWEALADTDSTRQRTAGVTDDARRAMELLRLGTRRPRARFRPGQEEAIRHVGERTRAAPARTEDRLGARATFTSSLPSCCVRRDWVRRSSSRRCWP